jgi:hypothetical protein
VFLIDRDRTVRYLSVDSVATRVPAAEIVRLLGSVSEDGIPRRKVYNSHSGRLPSRGAPFSSSHGSSTTLITHYKDVSQATAVEVRAPACFSSARTVAFCIGFTERIKSSRTKAWNPS